MRSLIITADDFGITGSMNQGIAMARREGMVTSVNLFPSGDAFSDAVALAEKTALKEAGAHLALTETRPVSDPSKVPTLVGPDGLFHRSRAAFLPRYLMGMVDPDQIYVELKAQVVRAIRSGLSINNLSSHEHLHMMPGILEIFIKLAKEYDIPAIRYPHKDVSARPLYPVNIYRSFVLACFEPVMARILGASGIKSPDHFRGFLDSADITEETLLAIIDTLEEGSTELVCHPGFLGPEVVERYTFHRNCEAELFALTSERVRNRIRDRGVELITYGQFLARS